LGSLIKNISITKTSTLVGALDPSTNSKNTSCFNQSLSVLVIYTSGL